MLTIACVYVCVESPEFSPRMDNRHHESSSSSIHSPNPTNLIQNVIKMSQNVKTENKTTLYDWAQP